MRDRLYPSMANRKPIYSQFGQCTGSQVVLQLFPYFRLNILTLNHRRFKSFEDLQPWAVNEMYRLIL